MTRMTQRVSEYAFNIEEATQEKDSDEELSEGDQLALSDARFRAKFARETLDEGDETMESDDDRQPGQSLIKPRLRKNKTVRCRKCHRGGHEDT